MVQIGARVQGRAAREIHRMRSDQSRTHRLRHLIPLARAAALVSLLTVFLTWPQAGRAGSRIGDHRDPWFSAWRLAWIAHALRTDPSHLYDANIYFPEPNTFAFSDAVLLQGVLGAPLIWAGWSPVLVYNVMLLGGIAAAGFGMFVLVRHLTANVDAALASAALYTLLPYRVEHFVHLEIQWTVWIPLAFWAVHRAVDESSWGFGVLAGLFAWLQLISGMYNAVILALFLPVLTLLIALPRPNRWTVLSRVAAGGILAAALAYPVSVPYIRNTEGLSRDPSVVARFSAQPVSYVTAPRDNFLWGGAVSRFGGNERHLFPGLTSLLLGALALAQRPRRIVWIYLAIGIMAVDLSLGFSGSLYPLLYRHAKPFQGLRAVARFSVVAFTALAVLAGFGFTYLQTRWRGTPAHSWILACTVAALMAEGLSAPMRLIEIPSATPSVYRALQRLPSGAVVELPALRPESAEGFDSRYQFWSSTHWRPLINGYSGTAPASYVETQQRMQTFPDAQSLDRLAQLKARYVIVHEQLFPRGAGADVLAATRGHTGLVSHGVYRDWAGIAEIFELVR